MSEEVEDDEDDIPLEELDEVVLDGVHEPVTKAEVAALRAAAKKKKKAESTEGTPDATDRVAATDDISNGNEIVEPKRSRRTND